MLGLHCCRGFCSCGEWGLLSGCGEGDDSLAVVRRMTLAVVSGDDSVCGEGDDSVCDEGDDSLSVVSGDDSLSVVRGTTLCLW